MGPRPNLVYEYKGFVPGPSGWRLNRKLLEEIDLKGNLAWTRTGRRRRKLRPEDDKGDPVGNFWGDIPPVNSQAEERVGYPTQKPLALLERILTASSNPGDTVLDPFCGCGTTIHAAQKLGRQWTGIDITHIAIQVILDRLKKYFPAELPHVVGRPEDMEGARDLARRDKYQFQWWAASLLGGQARGGNKKGADRGVDGEIFFKRGANQFGRAIISVKGGEHVGPSMIRDLAGTREREGADMAIFICLAEPTREMTSTAAAFGRFDGQYARLSIVTIDQLLNRQTGLLLPPTFDTVTVRDEARRQAARPAPKSRSPRDIRRQPEFTYPIPGDRAADRQQTFVMEEPLLVQQPRGPRRARRK